MSKQEDFASFLGELAFPLILSIFFSFITKNIIEAAQIAKMATNQTPPALTYEQLLNQILAAPVQHSNPYKQWNVNWATMKNISPYLTKTWATILHEMGIPRESFRQLRTGKQYPKYDDRYEHC